MESNQRARVPGSCHDWLWGGGGWDSFWSRGMNGWMDWTGLCGLLMAIVNSDSISVDQSCPGNLFQTVQLRLCVPKRKGKKPSGSSLATVLPQVSLLTHTQKLILSALFFLSLFLFLFFSFFFIFFSSSPTHTYIHFLSSLQCQVSCLADQPTPS